jgi:hypothetical protein
MIVAGESEGATAITSPEVAAWAGLVTDSVSAAKPSAHNAARMRRERITAPGVRLRCLRSITR